MIEDSGNTTVSKIAAEAHARLAANEAQSAVSNTAVNLGKEPQSWIARAPITIKMRLFCLPYAGGVSENIFGRYKAESG